MTTPNPGVNQSQNRALTHAELAHFLADTLTQASAQFHPGKLAISGPNSDLLQVWLRENDMTTLNVVRALLESHTYGQAVKTLVAGYVKAVKALMFEPNSKLVWEKEHPAVLKRRELESKQRGEVQKLSNDQQQSQFAEKVAKSEADAAFEKQEARYEKDVAVLVAKVFFVNPRTQTRDAAKIERLQEELNSDIQKLRKNGKTWGKVHAYVVTKINQAYEQDERDRVRYNSR